MADRTSSGFWFHHVSSFMFFALLIFHGHSLRLPSSAPPEFFKGDSLRVKVNNLASSKTQLPYSYYSLPYCRPVEIVDSYRNLWEVIRGDRIQNSPYVVVMELVINYDELSYHPSQFVNQYVVWSHAHHPAPRRGGDKQRSACSIFFQMRAPMICNILCRLKLNEKAAIELKKKIDDEYRVNMLLENLPLIVPVQLKKGCDSMITYQHGYFVGSKLRDLGTNEEKYFINNHLSFVVKYHEDVETSTARVVGFEVKAFSINHKFDYDNWGARPSTCDSHAKHQDTSSVSPQEIDDTKEITFTYDVEYQKSDVEWSSRWNTYIPIAADNQIRWFDWATRL